LFVYFSFSFAHAIAIIALCQAAIPKSGCQNGFALSPGDCFCNPGYSGSLCNARLLFSIHRAAFMLLFINIELNQLSHRSFFTPDCLHKH
jgi:hypothetical protein